MNHRVAETIIQTPGCFRSIANNPAITKGRKMTPYYLDLRVIPSFYESMKIITDEMTENIVNNVEKVDRIVSTETAGIPYGTLIANNLHRGMCWVKKEAKGYGLEKKDIEGVLNGGEVALGVDDLVNEANTAKKVIEAVRKAGGVMKDYSAVHDRKQGASETLRELNVKLRCLSETTPEFMRTARDLGRIPSDEYTIQEDYCRNQDDWSRKFVRNHPEYIKAKIKVNESGELTDTSALEVFTVGHPELLEEFKPEVSMWLAKLNVKKDVPVFDYHPGLFN